MLLYLDLCFREPRLSLSVALHSTEVRATACLPVMAPAAAMGKLPPRSTRGLRMSALLADEDDADEEFWGQDAFKVRQQGTLLHDVPSRSPLQTRRLRLETLSPSRTSTSRTPSRRVSRSTQAMGYAIGHATSASTASWTLVRTSNLKPRDARTFAGPLLATAAAAAGGVPTASSGDDVACTGTLCDGGVPRRLQLLHAFPLSRSHPIGSTFGKGCALQSAPH